MHTPDGEAGDDGGPVAGFGARNDHAFRAVQSRTIEDQAAGRRDQDQVQIIRRVGTPVVVPLEFEHGRVRDQWHGHDFHLDIALADLVLGGLLPLGRLVRSMVTSTEMRPALAQSLITPKRMSPVCGLSKVKVLSPVTKACASRASSEVMASWASKKMSSPKN